MSALARYFHSRGKVVAGYDKTPSDITQTLCVSGISVHYEDSVAAIPENFKDKATTLVIYTPAVPSTHQELQYFKAQDFVLKKRAEVLGMITKDSFCLAVAGTHGKTTTSCILAHLLDCRKAAFSAFLGGVSEDFGSNVVLQGGQYTVVEADEFDRSFLQLSPKVACITAMDADHLDIYETTGELHAAFEDFAQKLSDQGTLLVRNGLPIAGITYGIDDESDYCICHVAVQNGAYTFDIKTPEQCIEGVTFHKPGRHNLLNALAAFAMAVEIGFAPSALARDLASFKGVQRRFTYHLKSSAFAFVDDYAHHPVEIAAVYQALTEMHPGKALTAVFQPHLYSRTRDFAEDFAKELSRFDQVLLLEIYPAREEPLPGVSSSWLLEMMDHPQKKLVSKANLIEEITQCEPQILVTMGAGDIGLEVPKIKTALAHES